MAVWCSGNALVLIITPVLKKTDLDPTDARSYRPISNLSVPSKLLERLVAKQLVTYLRDNSLLPDHQSAYRSHHSTETAVLRDSEYWLTSCWLLTVVTWRF